MTGSVMRSFGLWIGFGLPLLLLGGCAGSGLQTALAPDPRLVSPSASPTASSSSSPSPSLPSPIPGSTPEPSSTASPTVEPSPIAAILPTASPIGSASPSAASPPVFNDLDRLPPETRSAIEGLSTLGVLTLENPEAPTTAIGPTVPGRSFESTRSISRRLFARWLLAANNALYQDTPARQVRLGTGASVFVDVAMTDPDGPTIQGLAEAGIIPSALTTTSPMRRFEPDRLLSREDLLLWKVPLDSRQGLPKADLAMVKEVWGFEDGAKISPRALRAVLGDYQNGDQSVIRRVFGFTTLFQPQKPVSRAEAALALAYFGAQDQGRSVGAQSR
jgi:S-layer homology domain